MSTMKYALRVGAFAAFAALTTGVGYVAGVASVRQDFHKVMDELASRPQNAFTSCLHKQWAAEEENLTGSYRHRGSWVFFPFVEAKRLPKD